VASARDNDQHLDELQPIAAAHGVRFLAVGFRPFGTLDQVPWMPKGRYRVMRAYLPTRGALAHEMMKRTTTVQANFDYESEPQALEQLRVAMGLSSLVTSLFAASPLVDGKLTDYQSYRARAWLDTDPDRCGLLPFAFQDGARFSDYAEWALVADWPFDERLRVYRETPKAGLHGTAHGRPMRELCKELVAIARAGLIALGAAEEVALLLAPLERIVDTGRTLADDIATEWKRINGNVAQMIDYLRLR
jgi:gamma-glutamylcysteine synthetase